MSTAENQLILGTNHNLKASESELLSIFGLDYCAIFVASKPWIAAVAFRVYPSNENSPAYRVEQGPK